LTLHVGAGTFKPVSSTLIADHAMHGEIFSIDVKLLHLLKSDHGKRIIAVGTTSVRTLESIYWIGHKLKSGLIPENEMPSLNQWEPYEIMPVYTLVECIDSIITFCERRNQSQFHATTSIMIAPGFHFRICKGMFTNFHLPKSTLLLLVSAFVGADWKKIYDHALSHSYRFLSYGDSSLLLQE
jgi:S-adenosylmethionine:tRNA ribosyltransferase-isomerase